MKTKLTISIIVAFFMGAFASNIYATQVRLIMVPDMIGGYNTIDLLNYIATLKAKEDKPIISNPPQMPTLKPIKKPSPKDEAQA